MRRIEAVTGGAAVTLQQQRGEALADLLHQLGTAPEQAVPAVRKLQAEARRLTREIERLKVAAAVAGPASSPADEALEIAGVKLVTRQVHALEPQALRTLADSLRDRAGSGVVVLASSNDGKAALVVSVTRDLTGRVHAGQLVKELAPIIGGKGGGRPDFAQAGGRQPERIGELFAACRELLGRQLAEERTANAGPRPA